eukprot:jgi/Tetstr1/435047/TSEL_024017.t1
MFSSRFGRKAKTKTVAFSPEGSPEGQGEDDGAAAAEEGRAGEGGNGSESEASPPPAKGATARRIGLFTRKGSPSKDAARSESEDAASTASESPSKRRLMPSVKLPSRLKRGKGASSAAAEPEAPRSEPEEGGAAGSRIGLFTRKGSPSKDAARSESEDAASTASESPSKRRFMPSVKLPSRLKRGKGASSAAAEPEAPRSEPEEGGAAGSEGGGEGAQAAPPATARRVGMFGGHKSMLGGRGKGGAATNGGGGEEEEKEEEEEEGGGGGGAAAAGRAGAGDPDAGAAAPGRTGGAAARGPLCEHREEWMSELAGRLRARWVDPGRIGLFTRKGSPSKDAAKSESEDAASTASESPSKRRLMPSVKLPSRLKRGKGASSAAAEPEAPRSESEEGGAAGSEGVGEGAQAAPPATARRVGVFGGLKSMLGGRGKGGAATKGGGAEEEEEEGRGQEALLPPAAPEQEIRMPAPPPPAARPHGSRSRSRSVSGSGSAAGNASESGSGRDASLLRHDRTAPSAVGVRRTREPRDSGGPRRRPSAASSMASDRDRAPGTRRATERRYGESRAADTASEDGRSSVISEAGGSTRERRQPEGKAAAFAPEGATKKISLKREQLPAYDKVLKINIQCTDALEPLGWLSTPVVRMHLVNPETGEYILRDDLAGGPTIISEEEQFEYLSQPERPVMVTIPRFGGGGPAPPPPPPLAPGGDSAGVEAGSVESPAAHYKWHSALLDFIPAVQTAPYDLRSRPHTMLAAAWNEEVTIDEDADVLLDKGVMLLFEVLQPPESMTELPKKSAHGAMRPLAWGFLKIQSEHGPLLGELKLQLYTYQKTDGTACLRSPQPQFGPRVNNSAKQAYIQWWKEEISKRRHKYPSFLQVKVDIIERKEPEVVVTTPSKGLRPTTMLGGWGGYELGRYDLLEEAGLGGLGLDVQSSMASSTSLISEDEASVTRAVLARPPGYPCQIPNALMHKLPGTPLGATALCFAHNGTLLAVAVGGTSLWGVQVWDIITGTLMTTMTGHHEMIYDISWSPDDSLIVTASSDYTAKVWDVTSLDALNPRAPIKRVPPAVLQHACFVYCAAFHPSEPHIVATGCYDNAIC